VPKTARRRLGGVVEVLAAAAVVVGIGYVAGVRQLSIGGAWAGGGTELGSSDPGASATYEVAFVPDQATVRFGLLLQNNGPLPITVRLTTPDAQSATDLDRIAGLRVDRSAATEGSTTMEDTVAIEAVEIPAFGQRWVVFEGRSSTCAVARTWNALASQSRQSVQLEAVLLGVGRTVSLALPFEQRFGPPAAGVCT
jgi:hypothetical protein